MHETGTSGVHRSVAWLALLVPPLLSLLSGCATPAARNTSAAVLATTALGHVPTSQIQQIYYLGVFDPRDQLPPTFYRVKVQGQASALANTQFASGWVRAELVDSLSTRVDLPWESKPGQGGERNGTSEVDKGALAGRRLMLFGPEGFREAPANHRLVIVMGSSPDSFFSAVDQALGVVAQVTQNSVAGPEVERALWQDLQRAQLQRQRVELVLEGLE